MRPADRMQAAPPISWQVVPLQAQGRGPAGGAWRERHRARRRASVDLRRALWCGGPRNGLVLLEQPADAGPSPSPSLRPSPPRPRPSLAVALILTNRRMQAEDFEGPLLKGAAPYAHLHIGGYFNCAKLHTEALLLLLLALTLTLNLTLSLTLT